MEKRSLRKLTGVLLWLVATAALGESVAVIGHPQLPKVDVLLVRKLYTGRALEVGSTPAVVLNAPPGTPLRERFMALYLNEDDEKYIAYWTVRRFIGKGTPPQELESPLAIIDFVQKTPGAIGYIDAADIKPGMNVLIRR